MSPKYLGVLSIRKMWNPLIQELVWTRKCIRTRHSLLPKLPPFATYSFTRSHHTSPLIPPRSHNLIHIPLSWRHVHTQLQKLLPFGGVRSITASGSPRSSWISAPILSIEHRRSYRPARSVNWANFLISGSLVLHVCSPITSPLDLGLMW
jgi:hypothetical protein